MDPNRWTQIAGSFRSLNANLPRWILLEVRDCNRNLFPVGAIWTIILLFDLNNWSTKLTTAAGESSSLLTHLASHRRCADRIRSVWPDFLSKREQRLEQQRRLGTAHEKVAENILEDLFTTVLDWPLSNFNNQVDFADIVLTDHGIKWLIIEVKRPNSLTWNRHAVQSALDQALRYAAQQKVKIIAVSDGEMLYAANIEDGGLQDRVFVRLSDPEPPDALWWLSVQGIWRDVDPSERSKLCFPLQEAVTAPRITDGDSSCDTLLHPKYKLPAQCFAYVGNYAKTGTWKLPYLLADGTIDAKRLPKAVQCILSNYRGAKVGGIPEEAIPAILGRLAQAARHIGHMSPEACNPAPVFRQLAGALEQLDLRSGDVGTGT